MAWRDSTAVWVIVLFPPQSRLLNYESVMTGVSAARVRGRDECCHPVCYTDYEADSHT